MRPIFSGQLRADQDALGDDDDDYYSEQDDGYGDEDREGIDAWTDDVHNARLATVEGMSENQMWGQPY